MSRAKVNQNIDLSNYNDVWVIGEQTNGVTHPVTIELIGEGRKLADTLNKKLIVVLTGYGIDENAKELLHYEIGRASCRERVSSPV